MELSDINKPSIRKSLYDLNQVMKGFAKQFWSIQTDINGAQIIVPDTVTSIPLTRSFAIARFNTPSLQNTLIDTNQFNQALKDICIEPSIENTTVILSNSKKNLDVPVGVTITDIRQDILERLDVMKGSIERDFTTQFTITEDMKEAILSYQVLEVEFPHTSPDRQPINIILSKELLPTLKKADVITLDARWNTYEDKGSPEMATVSIHSSTDYWEFYTIIQILPY